MNPVVGAIGREYTFARRNLEFILSRMPSWERTCYRRFAARRSQYFNTYWHAVADTVDAEIESIGYDFFRLRRNGRVTYVRHGEVMLDDHLTLEIAGNKPLISKLLAEQGFSVSPFFEYRPETIKLAYAFMCQQGGNYVVKPAAGSGGGRGITTKVNSRKRLIDASFKAAIHSTGNRLVIEREHSGNNYRLLYLNGKFLDAIRRDPPAVTGDGKSTLTELIRKETRERLECRETQALSPLTIDLDTRYTLSDRAQSLWQVIPTGHRIQVKTATNQNSRRENHVVRTCLHPSIIEYGRRISEIINVTLSGVDMMINDHAAPLEESGCVVNEINTTPGLHHHDLVSSTTDRSDVGAVIADYILSK